MDYLNPEALEYERLGALHYTGLIESWSNLYTRFAIAMDAKNRGDEETLKNLVYPDLEHGIDGMIAIGGEPCVFLAIVMKPEGEKII